MSPSPSSFAGALCEDGAPFWLTTLYVNGLPDRTSKKKLMKVWPPQDSYNFLLLPFNTEQRRATHYCFINFVSVEAAERFYTRWNGISLQLPGHPHSRHHLQIQPAKTQGLRANIEHIKDKERQVVQRSLAAFVNNRPVGLHRLLHLLDQTQLAGAMCWEGNLETLALRWDGANRPASMSIWMGRQQDDLPGSSNSVVLENRVHRTCQQLTFSV